MFYSNLAQLNHTQSPSNLFLSEVKSGVFRIKNSKNGSEYYWKLIASNVEALCFSENYSSKQSAHNGIIRSMKYASIAPIIDETHVSGDFGVLVGSCGAFKIKYDQSRSCYYWTLVDSGGEALCHSEICFSKQAAHNSIASCRKNVSTARIIDGAFIAV